MQIVIDIPDRIYYGAKNSITVNGSDASQMLIDAVKNGTPLPKEHRQLAELLQDYKRLLEQEKRFKRYTMQDDMHLVTIRQVKKVMKGE